MRANSKRHHSPASPIILAEFGLLQTGTTRIAASPSPTTTPCKVTYSLRNRALLSTHLLCAHIGVLWLDRDLIRTSLDRLLPFKHSQILTLLGLVHWNRSCRHCHTTWHGHAFWPHSVDARSQSDCLIRSSTVTRTSRSTIDP